MLIKISYCTTNFSIGIQYKENIYLYPVFQTIKTMKVKTLQLFAALLGFALFTQCSKTQDYVLKDITIGTFLSRYAPAPQVFTLDAQSGGTIVGANGTVIIFPPASFWDNKRGPVTGTINIELTEVYSKSDIMFSQAYTSSDGNPLISGGMFRLKMTQFGLPIYVSHLIPYTAWFPLGTNETPDSMFAFHGTITKSFTDSSKIFHRGGSVNWSQNTDTSKLKNNVVYRADLRKYVMINDSIDWVNCDHTIGTGPFTTVTVTTSGIVPDTFSSVFISVNKFRAVWPVIRTGKNTFTTNPNIPTGVDATIIAIGQLNGYMYAAFTPVTITAGLNVNAALTSIKENELVAKIKGIE